MRWQGVLFDLDGTLIDTAPDFVAVLNAMRTDRGLEALPFPVIRAVVSNGARALVTLGFGVVPGDDGFDALNQELRDRYADHLAVHTRLFDGMDDVLRALESRRVPWGIVTNKPSIYTLPLLEALDLRRRCASVVCADQVAKTKPDPEPMFKACDEIRVAARDVVYVGDHERDIAAGRNAGMATIAAGWGYIGAGEDPASWRPDFLAETVAALGDLLLARNATPTATR